MELALGIEVSEVNFDEFDRRKAPRASISVDQMLSKDFFANIADALEQLRFEVDFGMEVKEVAFAQFERRKVPR